MTYSINYGSFTEHPILKRRSGRGRTHFFQVEVTDYDGESKTFEIEARTQEEAARKADDYSIRHGWDVYNMNIYQY